MPFVGPIYTLPPGYLAVDGTTVEVSQHNPPFEDVEQALNGVVLRNGAAPMTAALNMGGFKITALQAATNPSDAARFDQVVSSAFLTSVSALSMAAGEYIYASGVNVAAKGAISADARTFLAAANFAAMVAALDADLAAVAGFAGTGIAVRTAANTWAQRQITSAGGTVTITNPAGVAGNINLEVAPPTWTLVSASATWTGGVQTVTGLGGYSRIMIVGDGLTASVSGTRRVRVGDSGGILSTSIYRRASDPVQTLFECTTSSTAERSFTMTIERFNATEAFKPVSFTGDAGSSTPVGVRSTAQLTQIQVFPGSGNINGGTLYVWGKV